MAKRPKVVATSMKLKKADATSTRPRKPTKVAAVTPSHQVTYLEKAIKR
jgi:hypothetical protein